MNDRWHGSFFMTPTILFLLITMSACGATGDRSLPPVDRGSPLIELAWMEGHWARESEGLFMEEYWLPPRGGLMLGLHRDVPARNRAFFEYLRIEHREEGIFYMASPGGNPATPFRMIEREGAKAVFENRSHDFPQRILYWIDEEGRLHARIEGREKGVEKSMDWVYQSIP